jgi:NAD(P)-dependent dehydrogenase (short-subunit alcohol dehydrogenase family)
MSLTPFKAVATELDGQAIDLLLNNAGVGGARGQTVGNIDYKAWAKVLDVNTLGPMRVSEAFVDNVARSERKLIITRTSGMGSLADNTSGGSIAYRSSKAAVNMAIDLAPHGITCVVVRGVPPKVVPQPSADSPRPAKNRKNRIGKGGGLGLSGPAPTKAGQRIALGRLGPVHCGHMSKKGRVSGSSETMRCWVPCRATKLISLRAKSQTLDVRFGSLADIVQRPRHVCSSPQSRLSSARVARPLCANSGHGQHGQNGHAIL